MFLCLLLSLTLDTLTLPEVTVYPDHQEKVEMLARLIYAEAGNQSIEGKRAVGNVFTNRLDYYEDRSFTQVLKAKNQFSGVKSRHFKAPIDQESYQVALEILSGYRTLHPGVLYFANERLSSNKRWIRYIKKYKAGSIGDHALYYDMTAKHFYDIIYQYKKDLLWKGY